MIETLIERLTAAVEKNNVLMEQALKTGGAAPEASDEPAPEPKKRGRPAKAATEPKAKAKTVPSADDVRQAAVKLTTDPTDAKEVKARKDFVNAIKAHFGADKIAEVDEEHRERVILLMQKRGEVDEIPSELFDAELEEISAYEGEDDDL